MAALFPFFIVVVVDSLCDYIEMPLFYYYYFSLNLLRVRARIKYNGDSI